MKIKYQENTKKYVTEIPNTDDLVLVFCWYTIFGGLSIGITRRH